MKFNRLPKIIDHTIQIFNSDGSFNKRNRKVCLLINSILIIIGSEGGNVYRLQQLNLELLRCGIYIEHEELALVIARLIEEKLIIPNKRDEDDFLRNVEMN